MTAHEFRIWMRAMRLAGRARRQYQMAELLGITLPTLHVYKRDGTTKRQTDLACAALLAGLDPYPSESVQAAVAEEAKL